MKVRCTVQPICMAGTDCNKADPSRPKTMGFVGSEEYIRLQFEEYLLSMVSAVKYHIFLKRHAGTGAPTMPLPDVGQLSPPPVDVQLTDWRLDGDPSIDFNTDFVEYWMRTENFRIFQKFTGNPLVSWEIRALISLPTKTLKSHSIWSLLNT